MRRRRYRRRWTPTEYLMLFFIFNLSMLTLLFAYLIWEQWT